MHQPHADRYRAPWEHFRTFKTQSKVVAQ